MRLKNVPGSKEYIAESDFVIHDYLLIYNIR